MTTALSVKDLRKTYAGGFEALKGISFDVQPGDFMALLGPNGAGKSTTIGIISSLVNKTSGSVSIYGCDVDVDFVAAKMHIGIVPQEFNFNQFEKVYDIVVNEGGWQATRFRYRAWSTQRDAVGELRDRHNLPASTTE